VLASYTLVRDALPKRVRDSLAGGPAPIGKAGTKRAARKAR
jgi:hypothetical protein